MLRHVSDSAVGHLQATTYVENVTISLKIAKN